MNAIPELEKLAVIAAALARIRPGFEPGKLASEALQLWTGCATAIRSAAASAESPLEPPLGPITLEDALRSWLPGVKHPDRMRAFREWRKYVWKIEGPGIPEAERKTIEQDLVSLKTLTPVERVLLRNPFLVWREQQTREARAEAGRAGAEEKAKKKAEKAEKAKARAEKKAKRKRVKKIS
jgi:hypothetical protein